MMGFVKEVYKMYFFIYLTITSDTWNSNRSMKSAAQKVDNNQRLQIKELKRFTNPPDKFDNVVAPLETKTIFTAKINDVKWTENMNNKLMTKSILTSLDTVGTFALTFEEFMDSIITLQCFEQSNYSIEVDDYQDDLLAKVAITDETFSDGQLMDKNFINTELAATLKTQSRRFRHVSA